MPIYQKQIVEAKLSEQPYNRKLQYLMKKFEQTGKDEIEIPDTVLKEAVDKETGANKIPKNYEAEFGKEINNG